MENDSELIKKEIALMNEDEEICGAVLRKKVVSPDFMIKSRGIMNVAPFTEGGDNINSKGSRLKRSLIY